MIINGATLVMLRQAYNAAFKKGFSSFGEKELDHMKVATVIMSTTASNVYSWLGHFPSLRQWIGDRQIKNLSQHSYTVTNAPYELTVGVDRDHIEDDQYGIYSVMMEDMGQSMQVHPSEVVFTLLLAGASTVCYDGQYFFDTDHDVNGSSVANYDATGGGNLWMLLDTARPLKPMIFQLRKKPKLTSLTNETDENVFMRKKFIFGTDSRCAAGFGFWQQAYGSLNTLDATNFNAYFLAMESQTSDEGKKLRIKPNLLVCGPSNRAAAESLIKNKYLANGENNRLYGAVELLVTPWLT